MCVSGVVCDVTKGSSSISSLLVLGLRNLQGCLDPPKLLSQLLLRKSLLQLRRRLLQCCRPGGHDNIVKVGVRSPTTSLIGYGYLTVCRRLQAFRYQRVLWPMPVACRHVAPSDQRPPVERDEQLLPLWLLVGCHMTSNT